MIFQKPALNYLSTQIHSIFHLNFAALNIASGTFGLLLLGRRDSWSQEFIIKMQNGVSECVESEERCLRPAVEVDGGVVGQERRAEIHIPRHFLLL